MRASIVFKLFSLTTLLCLFLLTTIYLGQTIFFKQYYANRKVNDIQTNIQSFKENYLKSSGDVLSIQKLEQDFYRQNNAWITTLDSFGNLNNVNDFYVEVKMDTAKSNGEFSGKTMTFPLYHMMNINEIITSTPSQAISLLTSKSRVAIAAYKEDLALIPYRVQLVEKGNIMWENEKISKKIYDLQIDIKYNKSDKTVPPEILLNGTISKVQFPTGNESSSFIYSNSLFMDRLKDFQTNLIFNDTKISYAFLQILDFTQNDVKYKLFIDPITDQDGTVRYIFSMASLQPVDEAVQMLQDYYVYLIGLVMLLIVLAAWYYSRKIANPLLQINRTTKRMASLDFSETIAIRSNDEIGDLSQSINSLSQSLHSYIEQLQMDIVKEKQLENTRREFISGVSHELKTPLSIVKSCISILKDGVATHKKDYYFNAMDKEVDKMNLLIEDMLELAKFESGTYTMKMETFNIDKLIEDICEKLSVEFSTKQLHVHTELATVAVMANQHRIEQVLTNFLTNASRYTPEQEHIFISIKEELDEVKVCIENKGAHIPADQLEKIWDRFYRGDTARHRSQGGTGLGLAISKNILELHGMPYGAANTEDGVLFFFWLKKQV
ncbi:sensor histidine kinase [Paenibacillus aceris]|uniref:histidine kinase n=1 Tax=Paenibacillus aceris TaxID=869555 RepID=A0ABS4I9V2_9BACL|nr:HAMP domain-containing sensor histidine kinase [Paenibacillus aceris]MBP1967698.1 signal transduction histidine kinase [Paenibacillus aceris]NHW38105.1 HAMP domain-containing protein [Paenibacillus aceris]